MAKAVVKCPICGLSFDRNAEEFVVMGRRYAHKLCHDTQAAQLSEEQQALKDLEEYIMKMFNETYVNPRIRQQIKRMREQFNYSYTGILKTLIFFFEVRKNPIEKANGGIGIVPYVYNDARDYYFKLHQAQQKNENKEVKNFVAEGRKVIIAPPKRKPKQVKLFNLEED